MINLLPDQEKIILKDKEKRKLIIILETLGFIFFLCLILILISIGIYISGQVEAEKIALEQQRKEFETEEIKVFSEKIKLSNIEFHSLNNFYLNQFHLTDVFKELSEIVPEGIYFKEFSYRKQSATSSSVSISGFSETQDKLLEFERRLKKCERFDSPYFPPSTWIRPSNINFNLKFNIINEVAI